MVSSISGFSAISYLDQVKGVNKAAPVTPQPTQPEEESPAPSSTPSPSSTPQPNNALQLSSAVLALLQGSSGSNSLSGLFSSEGNDNPIASLLGEESSTDLTSSLLGGSSSSNGGLLSSTFKKSSSDNAFTAALKSSSQETSPLQQAVNSALQAQANTKAQSNPVQNVLNSINAGTNAYNKVLLQNAQNAVLEANNAQSLVA